MSFSGLTTQQQSVVVKASATNDCLATFSSVPSGGCMSEMIGSSSDTKYYNSGYNPGNGLRWNHGYTLTGLTVGQMYIFVIEGSENANSDFLIEIKSGADNGCCPNVTSSTSTNGSCASTSNGSVTVTPSGGTAYQYDFGSGFGASNSKSSIAPGTYSYTVKETTSGCTYPGSYTIATNPTPATPSANNQSFCTSGTVSNLTPAGLTWYANSSGGSALPGSTALANNTKYYATQTSGGCESARKEITVTLDVKPTKPTSITANPNTNICHGTPITLTASGGVLQGSSQYVWGTTSGGSQLGTSSANTLSQTPSATTTYYVGVSANGACAADYLNTGVTVTLPTKGNTMANNGDAQTCYVSGNSPIHFYHSSGRYIGSINPNGRTGTLTMTTYVNASSAAGSMNACNSANPIYATAYMGRRYTIKPTGAISGSGDLSITFPFTTTEASNLYGASTSNANTNDNVTALNGIYATKFSGTAGGYEEGDPTNNCNNGTSIVLTQTGSNNLSSLGLNPTITGTNYYASFGVSSFSEFFFHGRNNLSPLPIELVSFSGNCEKQLLNWKTATEKNVDYFEILQSRDGSNWTSIGKVDAVGNSSSSNEYNFPLNHTSDLVYYKLRSVDSDGQTEEFNPISMKCENTNDSWSLYPNPTNSSTNIIFNSSTNTEVDIQVVDVNGKIVSAEKISLSNGTTSYVLNLHSYASGSYVIRCLNNINFKPIKLVKLD